jgi:hypothetical protein
MKFYKDTSDHIFPIEDDEAIRFLPPGCVQITKSEADAIANATSAHLVKPSKIAMVTVDQEKKQKDGLVCSNGIKLQVGEKDLDRWTQLTVGLLAFQPAQVDIRDYNNDIHTVNLAAATQMMAEVFAWGQSFIADTWAKKDKILKDK